MLGQLWPQVPDVCGGWGISPLALLLVLSMSVGFARRLHVTGYCGGRGGTGKGKGTGPTLSLHVGSKQLWAYQIDVAKADYPHDSSCGGSSTGYSPTQTATFDVTGPIEGKLELKAVMKDRNIHVVGLGIQYSENTCQSGECRTKQGRLPNPYRR